MDVVWFTAIGLATAWSAWMIAAFVSTELSWADLLETIGSTLLTLLRVVTLLVLATVFWVPVSVWIGLRPRVAERVQPLAQFLAAFPANVLFPIAVIGIVRFQLNPDIWLSPADHLRDAMVHPLQRDRRRLGLSERSQGSCADLPHPRLAVVAGRHSARHLSLLCHRRADRYRAAPGTPASSPSMASWGDDKLAAHGIGAYIAQATAAGDYPRIVLGIAVMSLFVIVFNRLFWRPLYAFAERRLRLD